MHKYIGQESIRADATPEILRFSDKTRIIFDREVSAEAPGDLLESQAVILRARQFVSGVSDIRLMRHHPRARMVDARAKNELDQNELLQLSAAIREIMHYDTDYFGAAFAVPIEDVVFDFSQDRKSGFISAKLAMTERLLGERVVFADALTQTGVELTRGSRLEREMLLRLGVLDFDEEPPLAEIEEYLAIIDQTTPSEVSFDPLI